MDVASVDKPCWSASLIYRLLLSTARLTDIQFFSSVWHLLWNNACRQFQCPVRTKIHGTSVIVNFGYAYPMYTRRFPTLNAPLLELAKLTWLNKRSPIRVVDAGAAIGDTVLLLHANLPESISEFICIDGDVEFFRYLQENVGHLPNVRLINCLLSSAAEDVPGLVRIHAGTASAQGPDIRRTTTLSALIDNDVDLLKLDLDGFDGRALLGAADLLKRSFPSVIFEWHPIICRETGNNWTDHFVALNEQGYSSFVWFTKYGDFSHFMLGYSPSEVKLLAEYCLSNVPLDWHYDVVALHESSQVSHLDLAKLSFASSRPSFY